MKKHVTIAYTNKFKKGLFFKTKTDYKLGLLSPETMKSLGSTKKDVDQDKDGEDMKKIESQILFTFVTDKQFGQLITISPHSLTMLKTNNAEFQSIEVSFTDQNNRLLEIEDNVNIALIIG